MGNTTLDLFRVGNANSARLDQPRVGLDITVFGQGGVDWVRGRSGGISTFDARDNTISGRWWVLRSGTDYNDNLLYVWNDFGNHWSWEPAIDMPLTSYISALALVNAKFVPA